jgi:hypothetical protein
LSTVQTTLAKCPAVSSILFIENEPSTFLALIRGEASCEAFFTVCYFFASFIVHLQSLKIITNLLIRVVAYFGRTNSPTTNEKTGNALVCGRIFEPTAVFL